ncbi:hypothetical protein ACFXO7_38780, partial [Nocardia tengchongensis]|uniref:hypothetical protein n=1 Tax=Nocardia tengchongensis TaxID=2055889 RepID=UPI003695738B
MGFAGAGSTGVGTGCTTLVLGTVGSPSLDPDGGRGVTGCDPVRGLPVSPPTRTTNCEPVRGPFGSPPRRAAG